MIAAQVDDDRPAIDYLRLRDEVLQVMYWMLGEGLGDAPSVAQVEAFLGTDISGIAETLARMATEGYLRDLGGTYELTDLGRSDGKRSFADEFHTLTHQAHGECSPDCTFCHGPEGDPSECPSKKVSHAAAG